MSEKDVGKALLQLSALQLAGASPLQLQTARVLERDRSRVRLLTGLTFAVWLIAGLLALGGLVSYGFTFPEQAKLKSEIDAGTVTPAERDHLQVLVLMAFMKGTMFLALSIMLIIVAAICTVTLILASRRATLRQVNASLLQVSEHLRAVPPPPGPAKGDSANKA